MTADHIPAVGDWVHNDSMPDGDVCVTEIDGTMFWGRIWWRDSQRLAQRDSLHPINSAFGWELVDPPSDFAAPSSVFPSPPLWRNEIRQIIHEETRHFILLSDGERIADRVWAIRKRYR